MTAEKEIRNRLLGQAIPSDYMRNFYRSIGRNFTDFELAAMLWNSRMKRTETLQAIKELLAITADSGLREQIENRLRYEREAYRVFADNDISKKERSGLKDSHALCDRRCAQRCRKTASDA